MIYLFNKKLENILIFSIKIGIFLTLLTPLILSPFSIYPAIIPKTIYFQVLVEILFFFYILLLLIDSRYRPKISPIFISLIIFFAVLFISTLKSINPWRSFLGTMERMEGFFTLFHFLLFFIILISVFKNKKDWINFLRFTVLVSIPIGLAAIIEKMRISSFFSKADPRISATLGNPIFYGNYLVIIIFLAIFLIFSEEKKSPKILFSVTIIINSIFLLLTGTRGAWVGMVFGISPLLIWFIFFSKIQPKKRKIFLFLIFFSLTLFLSFLLLSKSGYLPRTPFLERYDLLFSNLIHFEDNRIILWKLGIKIWKRAPLLGYGLESFSYLYDKNYEASFIKNFTEDLFFDRIHNKYLDLLVSNGILGLFSYLTIFIVVFFLILKYRKKFNPALSYILISLFIAYFVQNIFVFDTINSYLIFFLILAFIDVNFIETEEVVEEKRNGKTQASDSGFTVLIKTITVFLSFIFLIIATLFFNILLLFVDVRLANGNVFLNKQEIRKAIESYNKSIIPRSPYNFEACYYSAVPLFNAQINPKMNQWNKEFSQEFQILVKPLEDYLEGRAEIKKMSTYLLLAQMYKNIYLIEGDPKFLEGEEKVLGKAMKLNSEYITIYRLAGEMRFFQKREQEGIVFFQKAYEGDKDLAAFNRWLGISYLEEGEKRKGVEFLKKSLELGGFYTKNNFNLEKIWQLADVYEELGDYTEMAKLYENTISLYPKELKIDPQIFASLATVYAKMGEKDKARQAIEKMVNLYPELTASAQEFLSTLEKQ